MYLQKLSLTNFKNFEQLDMKLSAKLNCFVGDNGAGKTNLLDAIHYLSFCKSYFNPIDSQNIKHDQEFFANHGDFCRKDEQKDLISCIQKRNHRKQFRLNKKEYERLADHIGKVPLVMISPYDRDMINSGSEIRRKFIDSVIAQFDKIYLNELINYNKALSQRNSLLKQFYQQNYYDKDALEIWNIKLIESGETIHKKRHNFLQEFIPVFQHYFAYISGGKESVGINYQSQLNHKTPEVLFQENLKKERILQYTISGIHKDDLAFSINNFPIKKFGSQGQQKSYIIAVKLAQFEYTRNIKGYKPILLLDDVFDKLDNQRVEQLIKLVSNNNFGQVFITDTQPERIEKIIKSTHTDHRIFHIYEGIATEITKFD